jgi:D-amino peptidase
MRVVIWCDMEGISGITVWEQVGPGGGELYQEGRRLYTEEVNAAVRGAKRAGATEIVVVDCHGAGAPYTFKSLIPERLESGAEYVLGAAWMRYLDPLERCDAALCVGAHAKAGTPDGVLSHTVSSELWHWAAINDEETGETGICAAVCGRFGVPVVFVSGDAAVCREARALLGDGVATACVKTSLGRYAARHLPSRDAWSLVEEEAYRSLSGPPRVAPYIPAQPTTIRVRLANPDAVTAYRGRDVTISGDREVTAVGADFLEAWDKLWYRYHA